MNYQEFETKTKIIKETFDDERKILYPTPSELTQFCKDTDALGDIFATEDCEIIYLETQLADFDETELTKKVEFAESLYEKYNTKVSIYLLCPKNVDIIMRECVIKSEADFNIKIACVQEDACKIILNNIKDKLKNNLRVNSDDLHALSMLPVICKREDRNYYRMEYFKIINQLD